VKASLRRATPEDLRAISSVQLESARIAFAHIGPVEKLSAGPDRWAPALLEADSAYVAEDGGEVVGFAFTRGCELRVFYTHPRVWGQGYGRALLGAAEQAMRAAGCEEASVYTEERNHRPLRVYEAAGWRPDGDVKERDWLGVPIREIRLVKRLRE
jgi:GNAT superfamily N-acetyltransferase